ncbi:MULTISPECIES: YciI family protein [unclassified Microbacterium]|uniref:YciI family protein n=1 Tax=unclassified Microbacterium TaxID=2609290 RepID=UPI0012F9DF60|nr:YciI family protein [Microbacterium sp. MAH-37]MVQ43108.1 hypothetical protein [Microbacterium sp. MAH-37]
MPKYLMSVIGPAEYTGFGAYASKSEMRESMAQTGAFNARLREQGVLDFVDGLAPASTSTVVDARGPQTMLTDGPYVETKEYLNGLWIIDVPDLDAALRYAAEASSVCRSRIEVRPFHLSS